MSMLDDMDKRFSQLVEARAQEIAKTRSFAYTAVQAVTSLVIITMLISGCYKFLVWCWS